MPLLSTLQPATLNATRKGVLFPMADGSRTVQVLVSAHALDRIAPRAQEDLALARFNEYRAQFEQIASDKYDKSQLEGDGTICIRGRDLAEKGY
jgi:hypothetical protein